MNSEQFDLIPCDRLFARIEEYLSSYINTGLLDIGRFYPEIRWFIANLGIAMYEPADALLHFKDHKSELPCDFYLLDSAWLVQAHPVPNKSDNKQFQAKSITYLETTCEQISTGGGCKPTDDQGVTISTCNPEKVMNKLTVKEYITGASDFREWHIHSPQLLSLNNSKDIRKFVNKDCPNLFHSSPDEISIRKQGSSYFMFSSLDNPTVWIKYFKYPVDEQTKLPLIPDNSIIEMAMFWHLVHFFLTQGWMNNDIVDIDKKIQYAEIQKNRYFLEATEYCVFPSYNKMIHITKQTRRRWNTYDISNIHWVLLFLPLINLF